MAKREARRAGEGPDAFMITAVKYTDYHRKNLRYPWLAAYPSSIVDRFWPFLEAQEPEYVTPVVLKRMVSEEVKKSGTVYHDAVLDAMERKRIKNDILKNRLTELQNRVTREIDQNVNWIREIMSLAALGKTDEQTHGLRAMVSYDMKSEETPLLSVYNSNVTQLLDFSDDFYYNPYVTGEPGAGKTNFVTIMTAMAISRHGGEVMDYARLSKYSKTHDSIEHEDLIRAGIIRGKLRVYFPSIRFPDSSGKPYKFSYAYNHPWEIFIDNPKGSSVAWAKYDRRLAEEEGRSGELAGIYSMVILGEFGKGRYSQGTSSEVVTLQQMLQSARQVAIRYWPSGATTVAPQLMDIFDPLITMKKEDAGGIDYAGNPTFRRYAVAEYLPQGESKEVLRKNLGVVKLHPLTSEMNKYIAVDMSGDFGTFPYFKFLKESGLTDPYMDTEEAIENMSNLIMEYYDISSKGEYETGEKIGTREEKTVKLVRRNGEDDSEVLM